MSTPVPEPYLLRLDETGTPSYVGRGDSLSRPSTLSCESIGVGTSISSILNSYPEPCRIPSSYPRRACPVLDTGGGPLHNRHSRGGGNPGVGWGERARVSTPVPKPCRIPSSYSRRACPREVEGGHPGHTYTAAPRVGWGVSLPKTERHRVENAVAVSAVPV